MSPALLGLREWISPSSVRRPSVPPMDAGLRPNDLLDKARELTPAGQHEADDVAVLPDGRVWFSAGSSVWSASARGSRVVAELGGPVGALAQDGDGVLAAVEGRGVLHVAGDGTVTESCVDPLVQHCVTALTVSSGTDLLVCVGSTAYDVSGWGRALLAGDRSGALVTVIGGLAAVAAQGLAWPSGVARDGDDAVLVSLSFAHTIERRALGRLGQPGKRLLGNLPFYPGRIRESVGGWAVAAPYVRNRATELVLDEPELCRDLAKEVSEGEWPVPRLRLQNPYRDPLQLGQLRVLGVLKPWAPARSYGLVLTLGRDGRVQSSYHSRVDGSRHGVTGVVESDGRLIVAARGARCLLDLGELQP